MYIAKDDGSRPSTRERVGIGLVAASLVTWLFRDPGWWLIPLGIVIATGSYLMPRGWRPKRGRPPA